MGPLRDSQAGSFALSEVTHDERGWHVCRVGVRVRETSGVAIADVQDGRASGLALCHGGRSGERGREMEPGGHEAEDLAGLVGDLVLGSEGVAEADMTQSFWLGQMELVASFVEPCWGCWRFGDGDVCDERVQVCTPQK